MTTSGDTRTSSYVWRPSSKHGPIGGGVESLLTVLFPPSCLLCGRRTEGLAPLCARCEQALPALTGRRCHRCQEPLAEEGLDLCRECGTRHRGFDLARSLGPYASGWGTLVRALKFDRERAIARFLSVRLASYLLSQRPFWRIDVVTYVPMSRPDRRARGFNQARVLAAGLAKRLGLACRKLLAKERQTLPQAGLSARERRENLRGVFHLLRGGRGSVLLVDDIFTTGSTAEACAHTLKSGGYKEVFVLTVARA